MRRCNKIPRMIKMRSIRYKGFKITLFNNRIYGFRYEYKLYPLGPTSLRLTKCGNKFHKVIHDSTSTSRKKVALWYAKGHVETLARPELPWRGNEFVREMNTRRVKL